MYLCRIINNPISVGQPMKHLYISFMNETQSNCYEMNNLWMFFHGASILDWIMSKAAIFGITDEFTLIKKAIAKSYSIDF